MNVDFKLPSKELDEKFVADAKKAGMVGLKGYRSLGGIRVSMYNATTLDHVKVLVDFMERFVAANG
jgi:phosphoserine aminotransferase